MAHPGLEIPRKWRCTFLICPWNRVMVVDSNMDHLKCGLCTFSITFLCLFGVSSVPGAVVINEIHPNPDIKTELVEFIELHNTGASPVNIGGWAFTSGIDYTFAAGTTIAAGGYLVVTENTNAFRTKFGLTALGPWAGGLITLASGSCCAMPWGRSWMRLIMDWDFPGQRWAIRRGRRWNWRILPWTMIWRGVGGQRLSLRELHRARC